MLSEAFIRTVVFRCAAVVVLAAIDAATLSAQTQPPDSGITPLGMAHGTPAGSYALSGLDSVNHFNGSMVFRLPLLEVGGRGEVSHTIALTIEKRWGIKRNLSGQAFLRDDWFRGGNPGYGPGVLTVYRDKSQEGTGWIVTRLTFNAAGGTQYEFRDVATDGALGPSPCRVGFRGELWKTNDGTAATFEHTGSEPLGDCGGDLQGLLHLKDGTTYETNAQGRVVSVRDRNGNRMVFQFTTDQLTMDRLTVTDTLGRVVTATRNFGVSDTINFTGAGGVARTITVTWSDLSAALLSGSVQSCGVLFPSIFWGEGARCSPVYNPKVVSAVTLPNGKQYVFRYNAYAELAKVTLPTGGWIEYEHAAGSAAAEPYGVLNGYIYRRIRWRRTYDGAGNLQTTTYFSPEMDGGAADTMLADVAYFDNSGNRLSTDRHFFHGKASSALSSGGGTYPRWRHGKEFRVEALAPSGALLKRTEHTWSQVCPSSCPFPDQEKIHDPRIIRTRTTLDSGESAWSDFDYDTYNNVINTHEYDFSGSLIRAIGREYLAGNYATDNSIHIRNLLKSETVWDPVGNYRASTFITYDNYANDGSHAPLLSRSSITGMDPAFQSTSYEPRGNMTDHWRWLSGSTWSLTIRRFDVAGNVVKTIDPRGYTTTIEYEDRYGTPDGEARNNDSPRPVPTFGFPTKVTNALGHVTYTQFDFEWGKPVDQEDVSGVVTTVSTKDPVTNAADPLDRVRRVIRANNGGGGLAGRSRTRFVYNDSGPTPSVDIYSDKSAFGDAKLHTAVFYDGLGRETSKRTYETSSCYIVTDRKTYDAKNRVAVLFNPHRAGSCAETAYGTTTTYDGLDRPTQVQLPGGAVATTSYSGSWATSTDPAGRTRRSITDAQGRIVEVIEEVGGLNYSTVYTYDPLDNLTQVAQESQTRTFAYNGRSELVSSQNPESGTTTYTYDNSGNLLTKRDARGIVTTNEYDGINRLVRRSYSDSTPAVDYSYDQPGTVPYSSGRLVSVSNAPSFFKTTAFDPQGRPTGSRQITGGTTFNFSYGYDLAGNLISQTYPSGRILTSTYDDAGRLASVAQGATVYGRVAQASDSDVGYTAHGAILKLLQGNGKWQQARYNCRLQQRLAGLGSTITGVDLGYIAYDYGTTNSCTATAGNNGNLLSQTILPPGATFTQTYTYDGVNRLKTAAEKVGTTTVWSQTYDYDRFGNRAATGTILSALTPTSLYAFNASNNRINASQYDAAGNQTQDATPRTFTYDAENRQQSAGSATYGYDGDGKRVTKTIGANTTKFVYDAFGKLASETSSATRDYVYFGSRLLAIVDPGVTSYVTPDALGSTRIVSNASGAVTSRLDYLPFGEDIPSSFSRSGIPGYGSQPGFLQKFTSKERDLETNLDYFGARYFSGPQGRFTSADSIQTPDDSAVGYDNFLLDPRRWNKYAYTLNNPLKFIDPDGREVPVPDMVPMEVQIERARTMLSLASLIPGPYGRISAVLNAGIAAAVGEPEEGALGLAMAVVPGSKAFGALKGSSPVVAAAAEGGKHSGFLTNYLGRTVKELSTGIKSFEKQIAKHEAKILNPSTYIKDWDKLTDRQKAGLIEKWQKDIQRQKEQKEILEALKRIKEGPQ